MSYGAAKNSSKHPETFGKGEEQGIIASECANNACIGGAIIPLLSLGVPGSPPAAMLLGALLLHGIAPGPMLQVERPDFLLQVTAILLLASFAMYICGILLAKQVVKLLRVPPALFMPVVAVLCLIGSYALGMKVFNLYLMVPVGIICYYLGEMGYPVPPLVIGVILGPMADENLRRALMVSQGSFAPFFARPVSLILLIVIVLTVVTSTQAWKRWWKSVTQRKGAQSA
jgi:putative tricarboxylic transport membrane protein